MTMKKIVIDRQQWLRGEGYETSNLIRSSDGKKCCLGFAGEQCGIIRERMVDIALFDPGNVSESDPLPEPLIFLVSSNFISTPAAHRLMIANDQVLGENDRLYGVPAFHAESEREAWLTAEFLKYGIELEFIN